MTPRAIRPPFALLRATLAAVAASGLLALPGGWAGEQDQVRAGVHTGQYKPLAVIVSDLSKTYPGRVLDVETKRGPQGELRYEITLASPQGHKQELLVDAATGRVLAQEPDLGDQALTLAQLAAHLRRVEQQLGSRVVDAEFEVNRGKAHYKLKLMPRGTTTHKVLMDARTGALEGPAGSLSATAITPMPEVLQALSGRFAGLVREVELEQDERQGAYYEIELAQDPGSTLELHVDARTGAILKRKVED
ncbi:hypothetical protein CCO03_05130 [Comamonas serinivorans]|uniref:PepSY domain-containing protein n=1 Tax=Comamonas serinivorans TaxID=1082851 RepID=A0A1Y0EL46_9BURK|nr:PepSY domain-containing protein [Comamonas serinivorans]ARU04138.1 hypothetical protein CCO03_05130 [Comamonas serinivorans]